MAFAGLDICDTSYILYRACTLLGGFYGYMLLTESRENGAGTVLLSVITKQKRGRQQAYT